MKPLCKSDPLYSAKKKIDALAKQHAHEMAELRLKKYLENPAMHFETVTGWDYSSRTWWQRQTILNEIIEGQKKRRTETPNLYNSNIYYAANDALRGEQYLHSQKEAVE